MRISRRQHVALALGAGCAHGLFYLAGNLLPAGWAPVVRTGSELPWLALAEANVVPRWIGLPPTVGLLWCAVVWLAVYWFATGVLLAMHSYWRQHRHRERHPLLAPSLRSHLWHYLWRVEHLAPVAVPAAVFALVGSLSLLDYLPRHPDVNGTVVAITFGPGSYGGCADTSGAVVRVALSTGGTAYASVDLAPMLRVGQPVTLTWGVVACGQTGYEAIAPRPAMRTGAVTSHL